MPGLNKKEKLEEIAKEIENCQRCPLYKGATNSVPGEGNPDAKIFFAGEAPGYWEDQQGRPFVGQAGKLLDKLIESIGLKREGVWIGNCLKCRPPGNREPLPSEVEVCKDYFFRQLEIIKPKIIATISRFALNLFLPEAKISRDHGVARKVGDYIIFPLYHPAAALRSEKVMKELEEDFQKLGELVKSEGEVEEVTRSAKTQEETQGEQIRLF